MVAVTASGVDGWGVVLAHPGTDQLGRGQVHEGRLDTGAADVDAQRDAGHAADRAPG